MDIFTTKDDRVKNLDKRMRAMERKLDSRLERGEENFRLFRDIVLRMQKENMQLKKDRDYLLGSYKKLLDRLYDSALSDDLRGFVEPARKELKENFNLIREAAKEGLAEKKR
ncbi:MAG: hypothetical protein HYW27_04135 [Candidatus Aenigmarchaeota archaeon]|nr:hypothetical protein [Candidatus Aenigmarchaeota archaeon]